VVFPISVITNRAKGKIIASLRIVLTDMSTACFLACKGTGKNSTGKQKHRSQGISDIRRYIRIVYQLIFKDGIMKIIVIGLRADNEVYREAAKRLGR
jgi:hypothetical protein